MPRMNIEREHEYIREISNFIKEFPGVCATDICDETKITMPYVVKLIDSKKIPGLTYRRSKGGPRRRGRRIFYIKG